MDGRVECHFCTIECLIGRWAFVKEISMAWIFGSGAASETRKYVFRGYVWPELESGYLQIYTCLAHICIDININYRASLEKKIEQF